MTNYFKTIVQLKTIEVALAVWLGLGIFTCPARAQDAAPKAAMPDQHENKFAAGQIIVQFKAGATDADVARVLSAHGARLRKHLHTATMRANGHPGVHI